MALYREYNSNIDKEKVECLFTDRMFDEDIALKDIAVIEQFYRDNGYIMEEQLAPLLNYVVAYSRKGVCRGIDSPLVSTMTGKCSIAANICYELLTSMNIKSSVFNVSDLIGEENTIHELCKLTIPVKVNDQVIDKEYILDPTFKQFCIKNECTADMYKGKKRFQFRKATPSPGYFFNQSDKGQSLAINILYYGYFNTSDENLKIYGDAFRLFTMEEDDYEDPSMVGKISSLITNPGEYRTNLDNAKNKAMKVNYLIIKSPLQEYLERTKKNLINFINKNKNNIYLNGTYGPEEDKKHFGM